MIMDLIDELHSTRQSSGKAFTSIHVTHNLQFARRADRIVKLEQGKLIETALSSDGLSGDLEQGKNYV
jgi:ABC-type multidrug transport system fused ATPase/permease subunit